MKKNIRTIFATALVAATSLSMVSCSDDDDPKEPVIDPVEPVTTDIRTEGYYKGDIYDAGTGNLWINFISKDLTWDDMEEEYTGTGDIVCLDFNTMLAGNPDLATLADGTYKAGDDTHAEFTVNIGPDDSFVVKYTDGKSTDYEITDAVVTVTTDDKAGVQVIDASLTLDDASVYTLKYVGKISVINRTGEGQMSNLTGNVTLDNLTQGVALYWGETFTETSDYCALILAGADYNLDVNYGDAPAITIGLNVTPGSSTGIPTGTYTVIDAMEADDYEPATALSGVYDLSVGGYFGTWYFHAADALEASMRKGTVDVTNNGNNNYKIVIDLEDGYGHTVKGTFSGVLSFEDISE